MQTQKGNFSNIVISKRIILTHIDRSAELFTRMPHHFHTWPNKTEALLLLTCSIEYLTPATAVQIT